MISVILGLCIVLALLLAVRSVKKNRKCSGCSRCCSLDEKNKCRR